MNILVISPEAWSAQRVSKHHYAQALAKRGHRVAFLDPPDGSANGLVIEAGEAGVAPWIVRAPRVAPGLRLMPAVLRRGLEARWLGRLEAKLGWRFDIVWLFENSRFYDMRFAGDRVRIYHQVDLNQDFHVAEALASSDLRLTTTAAMLRHFEALGSDGVKIDHGVASLAEETAAVRDPRLRPGRPAVAYVGNLDIVYLDVPLLRQLIAEFPAVDFHLIGSASPGNRLAQATAGAHNVIWWGRIDSAAIVLALRSMDALLIAYDAANHRDQLANPHKLMEYMASGVVTIATFTEEYADKRHLLAMADTRDDYAPLFARVIGSIDMWNALERRHQRIAFARDNTYERQIERISDLLNAAPAIAARLGNSSL